MEAHALAGSKVGVFGKEGAGKSTVTAMLAKTLHCAGHEVYVLDPGPAGAGIDRIVAELEHRASGSAM
jgi:adenylylsulfate kinase-like enzyme